MKYLVWLVGTGVATEKCHRLLTHFGDGEQVWRAGVEELEKVCILTQHERWGLKNRDLSRAEEILRICHRKDIALLSVFDAAYPDYLRNIFDPPVILYVSGTLPDLNTLPTVTIVGQRKATPAGILTAESLAYQLSRLGLMVVSGMAEGIDSAAHKGALKGGSPTVAVFGTAIDEIYPKWNAPLYQSILRQGAVISEYPPGFKGNGSNFPRRNRIMSGLSLGTVVVEAPRKSGSLITAELAVDQGRQVFAVPGAIDAHTSDGTNDLIKNGAKLVTNAYDIIVDYAPMYGLNIEMAAAAPAPVPARGSKTIRAAYGEKSPVLPPPPAPAAYEKTGDPVLDAVTGRVHMDEIAAKAGLDQARILSRLTVLEMDGRIRQLPNQMFERIDDPD